MKNLTGTAFRAVPVRIHPWVWGSAVTSPSGVWGGAPAEIEFGAFLPKNMTSGGNNFNDFPKNQQTKFRAIKTVKANPDQNFPPRGCLFRAVMNDSNA